MTMRFLAVVAVTALSAVSFGCLSSFESDHDGVLEGFLNADAGPDRLALLNNEIIFDARSWYIRNWDFVVPDTFGTPHPDFHPSPPSLWTDGDGTFETSGATPVHVFETTGRHVVYIRATDRYSQSVDDTMYVEVVPAADQLSRYSRTFVRNVLTGPTGSVRSVVFSADGQYIYSASYGCCVNQWRLSDGALVKTYVGQDGEVMGLAAGQQGIVAVSRAAHHITDGDSGFVWWMDNEFPQFRVDNRQSSIALSPDGRWLHVYDDDLKVWSIPEYKSQTLSYVAPFDFLFTDKFAVGVRSDWLKVWFIEDWSLAYEREEYDIGQRVSASSSGDIFVLGGGHVYLGRLNSRVTGSSVSAWTAASGVKLYTSFDALSSLVDIEVSPNDDYIASAHRRHSAHWGDNEYFINLWRLSDGLLLHKLPTSRVLEIAISPDGKHIVGGNVDGSITIWEIPDA